MYNRYIPQPDGTFRRSRHADPDPPQPASSSHPEPAPACEETKQSHSPIPEKQPSCPPPRPVRPSRPMPRHQETEPAGVGIGSFLRQLLPRDFDTGDLMVILLLLLMSSDCRDDQNTALLTLAIYLFL